MQIAAGCKLDILLEPTLALCSFLWPATQEPHSSDFYDSDYTDGDGERGGHHARSGSTSGAAASGSGASAGQDYEEDDEERPDSTEVDGEWGTFRPAERRYCFPRYFLEINKLEKRTA